MESEQPQPLQPLQSSFFENDKPLKTTKSEHPQPSQPLKAIYLRK